MQAQTSQTDKGDQAPSARSEHATDHSAVVDQKQIAKSTKCTFSGVVPIDLKLFLESGVALVECPDCACTRTLEPRDGVLRAVVSRQTQNDYSQYRTTMGQGGTGLECYRRESGSTGGDGNRAGGTGNFDVVVRGSRIKAGALEPDVVP